MGRDARFSCAGLAALLLAGCSSSSGDGDDDVCSCYVDFPCRYNAVCVTDHSVQQCRTAPCELTCGCTPCSGATCGTSGEPPADCPEGTVCLEKVPSVTVGSGGWGTGGAACLPLPSGTDAGTDASDADYDGWSRTVTGSCR